MRNLATALATLVLLLGIGTLNAQSVNVAGNWTYRDGSFTDHFTLNPDGSCRSQGGATCQWTSPNGQLILRWGNNWTDVLQLPGGSLYGTQMFKGEVLSGTALGPTAERHAITLTLESQPAFYPPQVNQVNLTGTWYSNAGGMYQITEQGSSIYMSYHEVVGERDLSGTISAMLNGNTVQGVYRSIDGRIADSGSVRYVLMPNGQLEGSWTDSAGRTGREVLTRM